MRRFTQHNPHFAVEMRTFTPKNTHFDLVTRRFAPYNVCCQNVHIRTAKLHFNLVMRRSALCISVLRARTCTVKREFCHRNMQICTVKRASRCACLRFPPQDFNKVLAIQAKINHKPTATRGAVSRLRGLLGPRKRPKKFWKRLPKAFFLGKKLHNSM